MLLGIFKKTFTAIYKDDKSEKKFTGAPSLGMSAQEDFFPLVLLHHHDHYHISSQAIQYHRWPQTKTLNPRNSVQVLHIALLSSQVPLSILNMNPICRFLNCWGHFLSRDKSLVELNIRMEKSLCKEKDSKFVMTCQFTFVKSKDIKNRHLVECVSVKLESRWEDMKWKRLAMLPSNARNSKVTQEIPLDTPDCAGTRCLPPALPSQ